MENPQSQAKTVSCLSEDPAWFSLRSRTKGEHLAALHVQRQLGLEVFCPRLRFSRNTRRGRVWFVEALFPGYFFVRFAPLDHLLKVLHTQGVSGIVQFGESLSPIAENEIEALRSLMNEDDIRILEDSIKEGAETELVTGPLRGLEVVVTRVMPAKERVRILLNFLGGEREIEVPRSQLASPKPQAKEFRND